MAKIKNSYNTSFERWTMHRNPCIGKQTARTLVEHCKIFEIPITTYADNQSDNRKCYLHSPDVPSYDFESDLSLSQCQCLQCVVYKIYRLINYIIIGLRHGVSVLLMSVRILFLFFLLSSSFINTRTYSDGTICCYSQKHTNVQIMRTWSHTQSTDYQAFYRSEMIEIYNDGSIRPGRCVLQHVIWGWLYSSTYHINVHTKMLRLYLYLYIYTFSGFPLIQCSIKSDKAQSGTAEKRNIQLAVLSFFLCSRFSAGMKE